MKIGVLYPRSKVYPDITTDFTNGLKSYLKKEQLTESIHLAFESIGFGGAEKEVYEKVEKLLLLEEVDMVVAYIDEKVTGILHPLMQATGKALLVVNSGANYPESWIPQPTVLRLNLQDAFLCRLAGQQAGQQKDNTALVASTFYDCGYLHLSTMVNGFNDAGGRVVFNYINKQQPNEVLQVNELTAFLDSADATGNLLCVLGSAAAASFYQLLNQREDAANLHLFVSPMMLEPVAIEKAGDGFNFSINGYLPWVASSEDKSNLDFMDAYRSHTKKEGTLFSLLGWETGMILQQVFTHCKDQWADGAAISTALASITMNGPRGELKLDPGTNNFTAPFLRYNQASNNKPVIEPVTFPADAWEEYIQQPTGGAHSGWTNTYLCY